MTTEKEFSEEEKRSSCLLVPEQDKEWIRRIPADIRKKLSFYDLSEIKKALNAPQPINSAREDLLHGWLSDVKEELAQLQSRRVVTLEMIEKLILKVSSETLETGLSADFNNGKIRILTILHGYLSGERDEL